MRIMYVEDFIIKILSFIISLVGFLENYLNVIVRFPLIHKFIKDCHGNEYFLIPAVRYIYVKTYIVKIDIVIIFHFWNKG